MTQSGEPQPANHPVPAGTAPNSVEPAAKPGAGNAPAAGITVLPPLTPDAGQTKLPVLSNGQAGVNAEAAKDDASAQLLDSVVAVINGDVILQSDVQEEQHFAAFEPLVVPGGRFTPLEAMQHIVSRTLILQQMREQQLVAPPTDDELRKEVDDLRSHLPGCAQYQCETESGWQKFLTAQGFTVAQFDQRWRQRMQILRFIEVRFRSGIRIAPSEISDYYKKNLVPAFERRKVTPPPLAKVSDRIDEVLLQQRVTALLNDWLRSLRDSGNVAILDPAYASVGKGTSAGASTPPRN